MPGFFVVMAGACLKTVACHLLWGGMSAQTRHNFMCKQGFIKSWRGVLKFIKILI